LSYFTRVLSKDEAFPTIGALREVLRSAHPGFRLTLEADGEELSDDEAPLDEEILDDDEVEAEGWRTLLLATDDEVEVAVLERQPVFDGSSGQDEVADLLEDLHGVKPESGVAWLREYLNEVKTVYTLQHLHGSELVDGGNALHALRSALWERGDAILQADNEGFTNEEGYHIVWQFADSVSGPWNMAVYKDDMWYQFKMDLGDPEHRAAFLEGEVPEDLTGVQVARG